MQYKPKDKSVAVERTDLAKLSDIRSIRRRTER